MNRQSGEALSIEPDPKPLASPRIRYSHIWPRWVRKQARTHRRPFLSHPRRIRVIEQRPRRRYPSHRSESVANLLSDIELNFRYFSERALISLKVLPDFDSTIRRFESSRPSQKLQDRVLSLCGCQTAFVENPRSTCAAAVSYIVKSHDVSNSRDWLSPIEPFAAARLGLSALGDIVLRKPGNVAKPRTYEISISAPPVRRAVRYRASSRCSGRSRSSSRTSNGRASWPSTGLGRLCDPASQVKPAVRAPSPSASRISVATAWTAVVAAAPYVRAS